MTAVTLTDVLAMVDINCPHSCRDHQS